MELSDAKEMKERLDRLDESCKRLLIYISMSRFGSAKDLSMGELFYIDNETKRMLIENDRRTRRRRKILFQFGLSYVLTGSLMLIFCHIFGEGAYGSAMNNVLLAVFGIVAVIGVSAVITAVALPILHIDEQGGLPSVELEYETIKNLRKLEKMFMECDDSTHNDCELVNKERLQKELDQIEKAVNEIRRGMGNEQDYEM